MIRWESCVLPLAVVFGACMAGSCRSDDPPPQAPSTGSSTTPVRVTGTEKVVWDQAANDATALARYRYFVYVDDVPVELAGTACSSTTPTSAPLFPCSAALPKLSPGSHRLQLAVEETDGKRRRSPKSGTLFLDVRPPNKSP
jgi:hypothetical protein